MTDLNLTGITIDDLEALKDYIVQERIGDIALESFIEFSIRNDVDINSNHIFFLEITEFCILFSIIMRNIELFTNFYQTTESKEVKAIILTSIKNEKIRRLRQKLEDTLKYKNQKIDIRFKL